MSKCQNCGEVCGTNSTDWTEEDREQEARSNFGDKWFDGNKDDHMIVCEDCYQGLIELFNSTRGKQ